MAKYVDGYLLVVPEEKLPAYRKMAEEGGKLWIKYGALDYKECVGDDLSSEHVQLTFPELVNLKEGEKVIFSYILYESKAHRDEVNEKVMSDPAMNQYKEEDMPFDMKRMSFGGFEVMVDERA